MKTIATLAIALLISSATMAQSRKAEKLFKNLNGRPGVTMLTLNKTLLDFVNLEINGEDEPVRKVVGDLKEVKVTLCNQQENTQSFNFKKEVLNQLKGLKYRKINASNNTNIDEDMEIRVNGIGTKFSECHILFQGEPNGVLLSFFGNFSVKDLKALQQHMEGYK